MAEDFVNLNDSGLMEPDLSEYLEPEKTLFEPPEPGPNPIDNGYDGKHFLKDVYKALGRVGGVEFLVQQARSDPRSFMALLRSTAPKNLSIEQDTELSVKLIDRFGDEKADWTERQNSDATLEYATPLITHNTEPDISDYLE